MKYRLHWPKKVIRKLATVYLQARERSVANEFTQNLATVERALGSDPFAVGESRDGDKRITFESVLILEYVVLEGTNVVVVYDLRLNPPKV